MRIAAAAATIPLILSSLAAPALGAVAEIGVGLSFADCAYRIPCAVLEQQLATELRHQVVLECSAEVSAAEPSELILSASVAGAESEATSIAAGLAVYCPLATGIDTLRVDVSELLEWAAAQGAAATVVSIVLAEAAMLEQGEMGCREESYPVRLHDQVVFLISERE